MMHFDYYVEYTIEGKRECWGFDSLCDAEMFMAYLQLAGIDAEMYSL